ncbi:MAG: T9SS type A sorting domain-containing protein [Saprospiraceae bacterium]|jgi:hypothetical protein|nr:T9SS type A sorting domain-containing protein [Saprospiraceae bacterium]
MMKYFNLMIFTLIISQVEAQVAYESSNAPKANSVYEFTSLDESLLNRNSLLLAGAGVIWDLTPGQTAGAVKQNSVFLDIQNSGVESKFPKANLILDELPVADTTFDVFQSDNTGVFNWGNVDGPNVTVYSNPVTEMLFPAVFGTEASDTAVAELVTPVGQVDLNIQFFFKIDAWGEVKTPTGIFPCIRTRSRGFIIGDFFGIPILNITVDRLAWYSSGYSAPVATHSFIESELNGEISTDYSANYLSKQSVGTNDNSSDNINVKLFPNPTEEYIVIQLPETDKVKSFLILDEQGKQLIKENVKGQSEIKVSMKQFPAGKYLVMAIGEGRNWGMQHFVKQ